MAECGGNPFEEPSHARLVALRCVAVERECQRGEVERHLPMVEAVGGGRIDHGHGRGGEEEIGLGEHGCGHREVGDDRLHDPVDPELGPAQYVVVMFMSALREAREGIIDPLYPVADSPTSPTVDFVIHVLIVTAEVAALVVVYRLAKQQNATPSPQLERA